MTTSKIELPRTEDCGYYEKVVKNKSYPNFPVKTFQAKEFRFDMFIEFNQLSHPFLIEGNCPEFGLTLPSNEISMKEIARLVGADRKVRLIDVGLQRDLEGYTISQYAEYFERSEHEGGRGRVLNMISLEVSDTDLAEMISPPSFVNQIDWIRSIWPIERIMSGDFPKVQKYCLVGMGGSYTDFHIDFGGTSVWYHVLRGAKRFYLIPPTSANIKAFEKWSKSSQQDQLFFGDCADSCFTIDIKPGQTLIIPSGWIHAVYTPVDSVVFGGNFLNVFCIFHQLQAFYLEQSIKVQEECQFPDFKQIHAYFLCEALRPFKELVESNNSTTLNCIRINCYDSLLEIACKHIVTKSIHLQLPYLLAACEQWSQLEKTIAVAFDEIAINSAGMQSFQNVLSCWWETLQKLLDITHISKTSCKENFLKLWKRGKYLFVSSIADKDYVGCGGKTILDSPGSSLKRKREVNYSVLEDNLSGHHSDFDQLSDIDESEEEEDDCVEEAEEVEKKEVKLHDRKSEKNNKKSSRDKIRSILTRR